MEREEILILSKYLFSETSGGFSKALQHNQTFKCFATTLRQYNRISVLKSNNFSSRNLIKTIKTSNDFNKTVLTNLFKHQCSFNLENLSKIHSQRSISKRLSAPKKVFNLISQRRETFFTKRKREKIN